MYFPFSLSLQLANKGKEKNDYFKEITLKYIVLIITIMKLKETFKKIQKFDHHIWPIKIELKRDHHQPHPWWSIIPINLYQ